MIKYLFLLLSTVGLVFGLEFTNDYRAALTQADKEHKALAVVVVQNNCNWCEKLTKKTLNNPKIAAILKKQYIVVVLNKDKQELPVSVKTRVAPTTFLLNAKEEPLSRPLIGYFEPDIFVDFLLDGVASMPR